MAYTPINWQTGDTITAEKMNKMDNGWGVQTTEISETVVTSAPPIPGAMAEGPLEYSTPITSSTLTVSLNGTTYTLSGTTYDSERMYGEYDPEEGEFIFTTYPLGIISTDDNNSLYTETSGTYLVGFSVQALTVSDDFTSAVELAEQSTATATLIVEEGVTTWRQAKDAMTEGKRVVVISTGSTVFESYAVFASVTDYSIGFVGIQNVNAQTPTVFWLRAESADGVLS